MKSRALEIKNSLGLHARAAAKFVYKANKFKSDVNITYKDQTVNGKSIMGLLMLAAPRGSILEIQVSGSDQDEALRELSRVINDGFGEKK
jgi:phosphocarrier protein HPr